VSADFAAALAEDRRLVILRLLDYQQTANDSVLQLVLERLGHNVSRDVVRTDLAWLHEQGLIRAEVVMDRVHVATITERGGDVARGRAVVPGVKRPTPRR
jgi:repressor of nif and glnA expression